MRNYFVGLSLILLISTCQSYIPQWGENQSVSVPMRCRQRGRVGIPQRAVRSYMKRLRNASVEIDIENRKDLSKLEIIKMFLKGVKDCKNVERLREKAKGHVPPSTKRKLMKQKRMANLRAHVKNCRIRKQEEVPPEKNILNFPKNQIKNINAAVLYFRHYFEKYEENTN
ncbi:conserved Plasmodium protein, unknown function [Plasmodium knowlesi strain H]|uniref:Uncharacterized protein n=3 Tax=Plasmodium knowlesi TaxID=5850 RepID=A0A5K1UWD0_PLAKH|nr:conserved Plasmodium protein, unknown function [Plasmodium knowlesi strain H]OTN66265.1 Uncharacterized protein PKNOH_S09521100 [Plasmodium knowlesi]CAA9986379.1 conserved Plasmodium protein, unknown function [Plasmodium knowlesi strain H]SBO25644.1 conserved Plasmodium protein, unknown function [Plasmodium knowlesi strain H]SBO28364.1 conserved Plasmodium protein, unknown function [Plasmodium knowlesi strain H]VVS75853.1 conserved Plasmodium protein, unknown function [Plasmodium knowlesi s|eukprot:XP_002257785.1 hypothetical protein, conserved in Plasmodium species [Plasmodium knowlesi strain H]